MNGIARVLEARLYGEILVPLTLQYQVSDPVAIRATLGTCCGPRTWHVARSLIVVGLADPHGTGQYPGAAVLVSSLPHHDLALIGLHDRPDFWPLSVSATQLGAFVARTYELCPQAREQYLIDAEITAQLSQITHGGK